jgi:integrase
MSSITKTMKSDGTVAWVVRYRTPDGKSREKWCDQKRTAETFVTSVDHKKIIGEFVDPKASKMTFEVYAEGWLERKKQNTKPGTSLTFRSHLNSHLVPAFGSRPIGSITREEVKVFAGGLRAKVAPTTARGIVFTLAAILREAVDDNRLTKNVAERIQVGSKTERRVDPMHVAQIAGKVSTLAAAMPDRWAAAVLLMATTGLRLGECLGLTVDRVNFLRRTIRVDRQLAMYGEQQFGSPKTRAGVRTIPVSQSVIELLAAHLAAFPAAEGGLIFSMPKTRQNPEGSPIGRARWSEAYRDACAVAGVDGRTRTHDLRHVAASSMIAGGLSVAAVQAVLGHSSPAETLEVYTHLWPSDEDRTRDVMEAASAGWLPKAL